MTATIEISFYPLNNHYPSSVVNFLQKLRSIPGLESTTNGMSTIIIGPYETVWNQLGPLLKEELFAQDSIFVLKVAPGRREYVEK